LMTKFLIWPKFIEIRNEDTRIKCLEDFDTGVQFLSWFQNTRYHKCPRPNYFLIVTH
jgi:hypothetical protein